ncbi:hypothetical protein DTO027B5_2217 [Paecilomyces variotii]|nr:hypothetical protein DTO169C6_6931 [Paecilomyces variotii]KAJ9287692.1 hypothetical protein DTO021C3_4750 [Paecilomyces variotii]KAJ9328601.1 hypothetical protein DTO027B3_867 [Paecilomyces variotii]KAJ9335902.1 hypothetical protein DTO027B5_2217 [Paecilomyces variotii]KAJ9393925.1 hypothetical protein DTO282F9_9170 [Paecilomyces variotii]
MPVHQIAARVQALTLLLMGVKPEDIRKHTGVPPTTQRSIQKRAFQRGYRPEENPLIKDEYVIDAPRSGRPRVITEETKKAIIDSVQKDRAGREKSAEVLAYEAGISHASACRILREHGFSRCKPTWKPGLTDEAKRRRLEFAYNHEHWTLEDWKNVIWSDETSVVLGRRRGQIRVWRKTDEAYDPTCIRRRFPGASDFMFWGCFSWDKKGPCHIWKPETAQEKKNAEKELEILNREREALCRQEWELLNPMSRMSLRNSKGKKPVWRFTTKTGKLVRRGKGGVDWYRYQKQILIAKLIPFAKKCQRDRPNTIVQEDNAPSHAHRAQQEVYNYHEVIRMLWPSNSPDLNMIEPCWYWMKKRTTIRGAPSSKKTGKGLWLQAWKDLPQSKIQEWISRIPDHIKAVIACDGGNEYKEGNKDTKRSYKGYRNKGKLSRREDIGDSGIAGSAGSASTAELEEYEDIEDITDDEWE